jgi:hypothetical protein
MEGRENVGHTGDGRAGEIRIDQNGRAATKKEGLYDRPARAFPKNFAPLHFEISR